MTWQEIYNKYKDTVLMEKFAYSYYIDRGFKKNMADFIKEHPDIKPSDHLSLHYLTIKDIWGYLIIFSLDKSHYIINQDVESEEQMLHQAERFFSEAV